METTAFGNGGGKGGDLKGVQHLCTLEMVPSFKYLVIVLSAADYEWPAVIQNLTKAQAVWRGMLRILIR